MVGMITFILIGTTILTGCCNDSGGGGGGGGTTTTRTPTPTREPYVDIDYFLHERSAYIIDSLTGDQYWGPFAIIRATLTNRGYESFDVGVGGFILSYECIHWGEPLDWDMGSPSSHSQYLQDYPADSYIELSNGESMNIALAWELTQECFISSDFNYELSDWFENYTTKYSQ